MSRFSEIIDKGIGKGIDFNEKDESGKSYADKLREDMDNMRENDERLAKMHGSVHATMVSARQEEQRMMQSDTAEDEIVDYFPSDESGSDDNTVVDDTEDVVTSDDDSIVDVDYSGDADELSNVSEEEEYVHDDIKTPGFESEPDDGFLDDVDSEYDDDIDESEDVSDGNDEEIIVDERQLEAVPEDYEFGAEDELPVESESVSDESLDVSETEEESAETVDDSEDDNLPDPEPEDDVDYYYDEDDEEESESDDNTNSADESAQLAEDADSQSEEPADNTEVDGVEETTSDEESSEFLSLGEMRELVLGLSDEEAEAVSNFCNTDMFEGRREFVRLIERNNNIKVSPCDYKGLLDAFHMMYDEDMGKSYFEREKMVPVAAYGTKQVPFPSDEMLGYMYEHGYDSYGVTDSNRSVYK